MPGSRVVLDAGLLPSLRERPCAYPDARPPDQRAPYVYAAGRVHVLGEGERPDGPLRSLSGAPISARIPVLAVGSNAYPRQLLDKFAAARLADDSVPTLRCRAPHVAIAYAGALSRWRYIPATLRARPGASCDTWLQWLTVEQLTLISSTEGRAYRLVATPDVVAPAMGGRPMTALGWAHESLLDLGGGPIGLAEIGQRALLDRVLRGVDAGAAWDGCALPAAAIGPLRGWLRERSAANPLPPSWRRVARDPAAFAAYRAG